MTKLESIKKNLFSKRLDMKAMANIKGGRNNGGNPPPGGGDE